MENVISHPYLDAHTEHRSCSTKTETYYQKNKLTNPQVSPFITLPINPGMNQNPNFKKERGVFYAIRY